MQPFTTHTGLAAVMLQDNINTDLIIPKQFLKTIHRRGLGRHLFHDLRYREDGSEDPAFVLNREPGCSMCLAMNADRLEPGERCASTSNRNFEGRQGRLGRTHLMSPGMAAAAAVRGCLTDVREFL